MYYPAVAEDFTDFHRFFMQNHIFKHKKVCYNLR